MDYKKLGLICGLECHMQLEGKKLFCNCPTVLRDDNPDIKIERFLRPVASELGKFDEAAIQAYKKGTKYVYEGYKDTTCLVESDGAPPVGPNKDAVDVALNVSEMVGGIPVDSIKFMRKTVIDGSNTSGFQRTGLIAQGGTIKSKNGDVRVSDIVLEEDAARIIERKKNEIHYRLDRLGIPLIEVATFPDIKTPEHAKEIALAIGTMVRRTCRAKRGLGTVRQDVNISIKDGARCEIKGVQELEGINEYIINEIKRQQLLINLKKVKPVQNENVNVTGVFNNTDSKVIKEMLRAENGAVIAVKLSNLAGKIGGEKPRFGSELAGYAKVKAGVEGLFHSDELPAYGITKAEVENVRKKLQCKNEDAFALVAADRDSAELAMTVVMERVMRLKEGVIKETRQASEDGHSTYMRPLATAERMYPETDIQPFIIAKEHLKKIKETLPKTPEERVKEYKKLGLSDDLANEMKLSNWACFYKYLVESKYDPKLSASILLNTLVSLRRDGFPVQNLTESHIECVLLAVKNGEISKDVVDEVLGQYSENPDANLNDLINAMGLTGVDKKEIEKIIQKIVAGNKAMVKEQGERAIGKLMGDAMKELRGKADGATINEILKKEIKKIL
ncbi:MAG: Glu-tRNA(Gln) amidotransferase subunit GatE [Candidatus Diapherotrites archaeon]|nr:Glu-tRNA(Gln) amidotransferase subunit GatE [Candidatus Diapherotrites archaeon]